MSNWYCQHSTRISKTMKNYHHKIREFMSPSNLKLCLSKWTSLAACGWASAKDAHPGKVHGPKASAVFGNLPSTMVRCTLLTDCVCCFQPWFSHCFEVEWPENLTARNDHHTNVRLSKSSFIVPQILNKTLVSWCVLPIQSFGRKGNPWE